MHVSWHPILDIVPFQQRSRERKRRPRLSEHWSAWWASPSNRQSCVASAVTAVANAGPATLTVVNSRGDTPLFEAAKAGLLVHVCPAVQRLAASSSRV